MPTLENRMQTFLLRYIVLLINVNHKNGVLFFYSQGDHCLTLNGIQNISTLGFTTFSFKLPFVRDLITYCQGVEGLDQANAITDIKFESEIYTYAHSNGLFAGISFKGGVLTYNNRVNESLYSMADVSTDYILNETETPYNDEVIDLIDAINAYGQ